MIKFFRKIRQNLLSGGKTGKYLMYAIGEIILVVIGILIAIQINNWNTNRIDRNKEQEILQQLKGEYLDNKEQLQSKIEVRNRMNSSAFALLEYKNKASYDIDIDSFNLLLVQTLFRPTFDPALGVTNELIHAGKLYLIKNDDLRKSVSDWSGKYYNELEEEEQVVFDFIRYEYHPFLVDKYTLRNVYSQIKNSNICEDVHLAETEGSIMYTLNMGNKEVYNANKLLSESDFEDLLVTLITWNESANNQSVGVMNKMNEILDLIESEMINSEQ